MEKPCKLQDPFSAKMPRRVCSSCNNRMSSLEFDRHLFCPTCTGFICNFENRCDTCKEWSDEVMNHYLKHQASLKSKRESKRKRRVSKDSKNIDQSNQGDSQHLGVNDTGSEASESVESSAASFDLQATVKQLNDAWNSRFESFQDQINSSLQNSFTTIMSDFNEKFFSAPQTTPVSKSPGKRGSDPSLEAPQTAKRPGGNPVEQVLDGKPTKPGAAPAIGVNPLPVNTNFRNKVSVVTKPGTSGLESRKDLEKEIEIDIVPIDNDDDDLGDDNDDNNDDDADDDDPSVPTPEDLKPLDLSSIQFRQIYELIKGFFPSSVLEPPPSEESLKVIEGLYGNVSDPKLEPCRFTPVSYTHLTLPTKA